MSNLSKVHVLRSCGAEFRKSEKWENVFNGGATTSGPMDKRRPQLDSIHPIYLGRMPHEVLTVVVDVSTGGKVC